MKKKIIYLNKVSFFNYELNLLKYYYKFCFLHPMKIFSDLVKYLKLDLLWYLAFKNLTQHNELDYLILSEYEDKVLLELKHVVLLGHFFMFDNIVAFGISRGSILEEVIKILIEPIFEVNFANNVFGFRPYRTSHTALSYITTKMYNTVWVIKSNIYGQLHNISISCLIRLLSRRIKDMFILNIIKICLKFKVLNLKYFRRLESDLPFDNNLNFLLYNIYLDDLDQWMNNLCLQFLKKNIKNIKQKFFNSISTYTAVYYIRYGDFFILGLKSSLSKAIEIKQQLSFYLGINFFFKEVTLNLFIFHLSKGLSFLGYIWKRKMLVLKSSFHNYKQNFFFSVLQIEITNILKILQKQKICDGSGKALPLFFYFHLSQKNANIKVNEILSFFFNWYVLASNRRYILSLISSIFRLSLAKMYAAKFKLKTTSAVWKKGGVFLNKALDLKTSNIFIIPPILYGKYNQISNKNNAYFYLKTIWIYNYHLKKGNVLKLVQKLL